MAKCTLASKSFTSSIAIVEIGHHIALNLAVSGTVLFANALLLAEMFGILCVKDHDHYILGTKKVNK